MLNEFCVWEKDWEEIMHSMSFPMGCTRVQSTSYVQHACAAVFFGPIQVALNDEKWDERRNTCAQTISPPIHRLHVCTSSLLTQKVSWMRRRLWKGPSLLSKSFPFRKMFPVRFFLFLLLPYAAAAAVVVSVSFTRRLLFRSLRSSCLCRVHYFCRRYTVRTHVIQRIQKLVPIRCVAQCTLHVPFCRLEALWSLVNRIVFRLSLFLVARFQIRNLFRSLSLWRSICFAQQMILCFTFSTSFTRHPNHHRNCSRVQTAEPKVNCADEHNTVAYGAAGGTECSIIWNQRNSVVERSGNSNDASSMWVQVPSHTSTLLEFWFFFRSISRALNADGTTQMICKFHHFSLALVPRSQTQ